MERTYVGTSGWVYRHWSGVFYPKTTPQKSWLDYYTQYFKCVELNSSFYRLPKTQTFMGWREKTPEDFIFSVKMSRYVTHMKRLSQPGRTLPGFFEAVAGLNEKCGPILIQLPPNLPCDKKTASEFLEELVVSYPGYMYTLECRHESWFNPQVYNLLAERNINLCFSDTPDYPYHEEITSDFIYCRLHGHEQLYSSDYSDGQLRDWAQKITGWTSIPGFSWKLRVFSTISGVTSGSADTISAANI